MDVDMDMDMDADIERDKDQFDPEELALFERIRDGIADKGMELIRELNSKWARLGVRRSNRLGRTQDLLAIVQERYDEVLQETLDRIRTIEERNQELRNKIKDMQHTLSLPEDVQVFDPDTPLNIVNDALQSEYIRYKEWVDARMKKISSLEEMEKTLNYRLGMKPFYVPTDRLPDENQVRDWYSELSRRQEECDRRMGIFMKKREEMRSLLNELETTQYDQFQYYVLDSTDDDFRPTDFNMNKLNAIVEDLSQQLDDRKAEALEIRNKIRILWERLEEDPDYCRTFLMNHVGHGRVVKAALLEELHRCEEKKKLSFKMIIVKVRKEIEAMWNKCLYSLNQRDRFTEYYSSIFNEDLLTLHEMHLKELQDFYEENRKIFELYETRQKLWTQWNELEAKSREPGRFTNRGGQLLIEERERKTLMNKLPKIEKELTKLANLYEETHERPFTVFGENLVETMEREIQENKQARLLKSSARKQQSVISSSVPTNRCLYMSNRLAATNIKNMSSTGKNLRSATKTRCVPRRLYMKQGVAVQEDPKKTPNILVNGHPIAKKKLNLRKSKELKRKSKNHLDLSMHNASEHDVSVASYAGFQNYVNSNVESRSSAIDHNVLHLREPVANLSPIGESTTTRHTKAKNKENILPEKSAAKNIDIFATPRVLRRSQTNQMMSSCANSTGKPYNMMLRSKTLNTIKSPMTPRNNLKVASKIPFLI